MIPESKPAKCVTMEDRCYSELVYGYSAAGIAIRCGNSDAAKKSAVQCLSNKLTHLWVRKASDSGSASIQAIAKKGEEWLPDGQDAVSHVHQVRRTRAPQEFWQRGLF